MRHAAVFAARRTVPLLKAALVLPFAMVLGRVAIEDINGWLNPFTGFRPVSVSVPNHCEGENPVVHVTRFSQQRVKGSFYTSFDPDTGGAPVCPFQSVVFDYKPRTDFFFATDLDSYFGQGRHCELPPGRYRGEIQWTFKRPWHAPATVQIETFPFEVWGAADRRCQG